MLLEEKKQQTSKWFSELRDLICEEFEKIEQEASINNNNPPGKFIRTKWQRNEENGGGGEMSIMRGRVFEKIGVNISIVQGKFSPQMQQQIPGASESPEFFATGISLVAHLCSPLIPAVHMNTRYIVTSFDWFGGGADLTPIYPNDEDTDLFHDGLRKVCDRHNSEYYPKYKKECDEYFYLQHRNENRGVGGIFYDYLNNNWQEDFEFTKDVGKGFLEIYPKIVRRNMHKNWNDEQREYQLYKRGRYVEFNLLYDRGTKFGLMTGGNIEAIMMSMPPIVKW